MAVAAVSTQNKVRFDGLRESGQTNSVERHILHGPHQLAELGLDPLTHQRNRNSVVFDELQSGREIRNHFQSFTRLMNSIEFGDVLRRQNQAAGYLRDSGVTFTVYDNVEGAERIWPFDLLPRIVDADEWLTIERGLKQRIRALNLFIGDVYGAQAILRDGVVPRELIESAPAFRSMFCGVRPQHNVWCHVSGVDLVRDADGTIYVLEDNLRCPSGVSYALENRGLMQRLFAEAFEGSSVSEIEDYPRELLTKLNSTARGNQREVANVVVLSPGSYNSAYFEHTYLARRMGVPLVFGSDLFVQDKFVYMRTIGGASRVDVIYRRIDDEFLDPLCFRKDSLIGVPGLMDAYVAGNVTLANAPGCGVADDKAVYAYVPKIIEYYLNEQPILANVPTYICADPKQRDYVLSNIAKLVIKPTNASGGSGVMIGPHCSREEHEACADAIRTRPRDYIAQPMLSLSTVPTIVEESLRPRHVDLRPFVVAGRDDIYVMPGGLTRVALPAGSLIVNSSQGGGSKDTWVLERSKMRKKNNTSGFPVAQDMPRHSQRGELTLPPRVAFSLFWLHRYLERAEGMARLLHDRNLSASKTSSSWKTLVTLFADLSDFQSHHESPNIACALQWVMTDERNPNSILSCLISARENARETRNVLLDEVWIALNSTYHRLRELTSQGVDQQKFLEPVIELNSLVREFSRLATRRDEVWHVARLAGMIEYADMVTRSMELSLNVDEPPQYWSPTYDGLRSIRLDLLAGEKSIRWLRERCLANEEASPKVVRTQSQWRLQRLQEKVVRSMLKPSLEYELRSVIRDIQVGLSDLANQIVSDFMTINHDAARMTQGHVHFGTPEAGPPANHLTITAAESVER